MSDDWDHTEPERADLAPLRLSPPVEAAVRAGWAFSERTERWYEAGQVESLPEFVALRGLDDAARRSAVLEAARVGVLPGERWSSASDRVIGLRALELLAARRVPLGPGEVAELLAVAVEGERLHPHRFSGEQAGGVIRPLLRSIEAAADGWTVEEQAGLTVPLRDAAAAVGGDLGTRLAALARRDRDGLPVHLLADDEAFGLAVIAFLRGSAEPADALGAAIELFAGIPATGKPPKRWLASADAVAQRLADPVGLVDALLGVFAVADETVRSMTDFGQAHEYTVFAGELNERFALGVLRFAGTLAAPELLAPLARNARHMVVVIGGEYGSPRSLKLANASVVAIADTARPESIRELLALERVIRHGSLLNQIRKSIDALAAAQGVTRDELLEQAVEAHDLDAGGARSVPLGRGVARIEVTSRAASLTFVDEQGVAKKSFPPDVKAAEEETLAALKGELGGIRKTIAAERARLDGQLAAGRTWPVEEWRRLYLGHPVTGRLARDLIWTVRGGDADLVGRPLDGDRLLLDDGTEAAIGDGATIGLWHPVVASPMEVGAWRHHCVEHRLIQPVKQAFRELYVLTPAERETRVYSNRFASHVFRQVQARALMKGRGWKAPPLAWWDDGRDVGVATRELAGGRLRAQFVYDPITEVEPDGGDLYPLCSSDQLRFVDPSQPDGDDALIPLEDVPPLVFSEVMRDVDLFIGVTSIGADPEWQDRGHAAVLPRFNEYWTGFSFGDLSAAAEIRREVIAGLLPSLAIADRCELDERFLRVRGRLRNYAIHLGSGNIQMEPNTEYLCIVSARSRQTGKLFLPFDDDPILTLILSKAFLLAADDEITDETILAQIRRA